MNKTNFNVILIGIVFDPKSRMLLLGKNKGDKEFSFLEGELSQNRELDIELKKVAKEKTGYKIHNLGAIYARNCLKDCKEKLELFFLCEATEGKEKPGKNVDELIWIKPLDIKKYLKEKLPSRLKEYIASLA